MIAEKRKRFFFFSFSYVLAGSYKKGQKEQQARVTFSINYIDRSRASLYLTLAIVIGFSANLQMNL